MNTIHSISEIPQFIKVGDVFKGVSVNDNSSEILFENKRTISNLFEFIWESIQQLWTKTPIGVTKRKITIFKDAIPPKITQDDLRALFACKERESMRAHLSEKMPHVLEFLKLANTVGKTDIMAHNTLMQAVYVVVGLKPALAIEPRCPGTAKNILILATQFFPHLRLIQRKDGHSFLVNEQPLPEFDPRAFIRNFTTISEAVTASFPSNYDQKKDQVLSYVLGFGPTWEAFMLNAAKFEKTQPIDIEASVFTDLHYEQLGKSLAKGSSSTERTFIDAGKKYHQSLGALCNKVTSQQQKMTIKEHLESIKEQFTTFKQINDLSMEHIVDDVSLQTDYIQAAIAYRKLLVNL